MDLLALLWNQMMLHSFKNESQCQTSVSYQQHLTKTTDTYLWKVWTAVIMGGSNHKLYWLAIFLHVHLFVHIHRFNWKLKQYISFFDERWGWCIVHIGIMIYPSQQQRNEMSVSTSILCFFLVWVVGTSIISLTCIIFLLIHKNTYNVHQVDVSS